MKRISFNLEARKTDKGFPIYIRMTQNKQHKRIRTPITLKSENDWNPKRQEVRSHVSKSKQWNDYLKKEKERVEKIYLEDTNVSLDALFNKAQNNESSKSFVQFANAHSDKVYELGKSSAKQWKDWCTDFVEFLQSINKADISFSELDYKIVTDFQTYLTKRPNKNNPCQQLKQNTILGKMKKLTKLVNDAIREGLIEEGKSPLKDLKKPKEVKSNKMYLTDDDINTIMSLDYEKNSKEWDVRNAFLFSYFMYGIRVSDVLQMRWSNIIENGEDWILTYIMSKTKEIKAIYVVPSAKDILIEYKKTKRRSSDYIFPFLDNDAPYAKYKDIDVMPIELRVRLQKSIESKETILNRVLKKIQKDAGISTDRGKLTNHISRHSFAMLALKQNIDVKDIQGCLGHSKLTTTDRYLRELKGADKSMAKNIYSNFDNSNPNSK